MACVRKKKSQKVQTSIFIPYLLSLHILIFFWWNWKRSIYYQYVSVSLIFIFSCDIFFTLLEIYLFMISLYKLGMINNFYVKGMKRRLKIVTILWSFNCIHYSLIPSKHLFFKTNVERLLFQSKAIKTWLNSWNINGILTASIMFRVLE